jgi:cytochrome c oxidase subunit I+III
VYNNGFSLKRWLTTTNHKDIGILYLVTSIFFLALAGTIAELVRGQLAVPNGSLLTPALYEQAVSFHGLVMILWFLSPFGTAFANYFVPTQIGAKDMAFPRLNAMSYWLYVFSGLMLISTIFLPGGGPQTGWTLYAPLTTTEFMPQPGMTLSVLAIGVLAVSITMSSVNFLTTILRTRIKKMRWWKMPAFSWSVLFTNFLMLFAFPPLIAGALLLTMDRVFGTVFFSSPLGGALLWTQYFWFFGHPEVYIVVLPALGAIAEIFVTFSKRPLFQKRVFLIEMAAVTVLSVGVWIHHMFMTGIALGVRETFSFTTMAISVPFEGLVIGLVLTLRKSALRITTPMLFAMGALFFVILGGITGVFQASIALDYAYRGTYWVVGHFHYVMVGTTIFGLVAALYYWFPKITGRMYNEKIGKLTFLFSFIGFNVLYFPYFLLQDMPRRIASYAANPEWFPLNLTATVGALIFGPFILISFLNIGHSAFTGAPCEPNPWDAVSTEWTGDYSIPEPDDPEGGIEESENDNEPEKEAQPQPPSIVPPQNQEETASYEEERSTRTYLPVVVAGGVIFFLYGFIMFAPLAIIGLLIMAGAVVKWFHDDYHDKYAEIKQTLKEKWPFETVSKEKLGLWIFLMSEIVLFGCLISGYIYVRLGSSTWPLAAETHNVVIGSLNTVLLLTSSLAMILAVQAAKNNDQLGIKAGILGAFTLGAMFLMIKLSIEWPREIINGFVITGGLAPSTYYMLMGAHAIHVGIGLGGLAYLMAKGFAGKFTPQSHTALELIGLYWAFVDIVWIFLFPLFYLI